MIKKIFNILGVLIFLSLSSVLIQSASTFVEFTNSFNTPVCYHPEDDSDKAFWITSEGTINANLQCSMEGGIPDDTGCCPINLPICNSDDKCEIGVNSCSSFKTQIDCSGHFNIAQFELNGISENCNAPTELYNESTRCLWYLKCDCKWNGTTCLAASENLVLNNSGQLLKSDDSSLPSQCGNPIYNYSGTCYWDIDVKDDCEQSGKILKSWTVDWTGTKSCPPNCGATETCLKGICRQSSCIDGSKEFLCKDTAKLAFFTTSNFIIAGVIIIVIYIFYVWHDKKTLKKKKHK